MKNRLGWVEIENKNISNFKFQIQFNFFFIFLRIFFFEFHILNVFLQFFSKLYRAMKQAIQVVESRLPYWPMDSLRHRSPLIEIYSTNFSIEDRWSRHHEKIEISFD